MSADPNTQTTQSIIVLARQCWDAERAALRVSSPDWPMPAWSRAAAWRRRPYVLAATYGGCPSAE